MNNRQQQIIYRLMNANQSVTAGLIAKDLGISIRTVKSEMKIIQEELEVLGASLVAIRGKGYSIKVLEKRIFKPFMDQMNIKAYYLSSFARDDRARFLYIARKLVASSRYSKIEDIAHEMYLSRSSLRESIKAATQFLDTYRLNTESKPGLGIRTYGMEYHARLAMMELFALHFHRAKVDNNVLEYSKWIHSDENERQDIRHNFLRTLMNSNIRLLDLDTQRLFVYFIIARNRYQAGYRLRLPITWVEEIHKYEEYQVAKNMLTRLNKNFEGYDMNDDEVAFVAIFLICLRDYSLADLEDEKITSTMNYMEARDISNELIMYISQTYQCEFQKAHKLRDQLICLLIPYMARKDYDLDGLKRIDFMSERSVSAYPFATQIARDATLFLMNKYDNKWLDQILQHKIAGLFHMLSAQLRYKIKPLKFLIVNQNCILLSEIIKEKLMTYYSALIESIDFVELYEIRGMDQSEYDAVLTDTDKFAYNYDLDHLEYKGIFRELELKAIHNKLLIKAFQINNYLPKKNNIKIYSHIQFANKEEVFQLLALKHAKNDKEQQDLNTYFRKQEQVKTYRYKQKVFISAKVGVCPDDTIEIYNLKTPCIWDDKEIKTIFFVSLQKEHLLMKMKIYDDGFNQILNHNEILEDSINNEEAYNSIKKAIERSLYLF